jgi:hypothetical protein
MEPQLQGDPGNTPPQSLPEVPTAEPSAVESAYTSQPSVDSSSQMPVTAPLETQQDTEESSEQELLTRKPVIADYMLEWSASEYIEHKKTMIWYIVLLLIAAGLLAVAILVLHEYTFAALVIVMTIAIVLWARRPAQEIAYKLQPDGVWVGQKFFPFHNFRAFGVVQDSATYSVMLLPVKRFAPGVTIHFPTELGEQIVDVLGSVMPMETIKPDFIDKLSKRLNF